MKEMIAMSLEQPFVRCFWGAPSVAAFFLCMSWSACVIGQTVEISYDVYSKEFKIGTMKTTRSRLDNKGKPAVAIDTTGEVRAKVLFFKYCLDFKEHAVLDPGDGLVSYESDTTENGKRKIVKGCLGASGFDFSVTEKGESNNSTVMRKDYEATSVGTVERRIKRGDAKRRFRVLDLDRLSVENWTLGYMKEETIAIADRGLLCSVVSFDGSGATGRRWIARDELGPFLAKEIGKDKDGPYSFVMTAYSTDAISRK